MGNVLKIFQKLPNISKKEEKLSLDELYIKTWAIASEREIKLTRNLLKPYNKSIGAVMIGQNKSSMQIESFGYRLENFYLTFEKEFGAYMYDDVLCTQRFKITIAPNLYNHTVNVYGDWKCVNATIQFYEFEKGLRDHNGSEVFHDHSGLEVTYPCKAANFFTSKSNEITGRFKLNSKYLLEKSLEAFSRRYKGKIQDIVSSATPLPQSIIVICLLPFIFPAIGRAF